MKWSKPGRLSTRLRRRGRRRRARRNCALIQPARGDRRRQTNYWLVTRAPGGDYDAISSRNAAGSRNDLITMPAIEAFTAGLPVEVGQIDRELKKLWDASGGVMTRASLINLAVYSEAPDSLGRNTAIISQITENHACRAIVIAADPGSKKSEVEAWISAHCHVSQAGRKQVCSEQLSFLLKGKQCGLLPNIVFAQLDSDLPLYLWWQEEFRS